MLFISCIVLTTLYFFNLNLTVKYVFVVVWKQLFLKGVVKVGGSNRTKALLLVITALHNQSDNYEV